MSLLYLRDEWFGKDGISDMIRSKLGILTVTQMAEAVQPDGIQEAKNLIRY